VLDIVSAEVAAVLGYGDSAAIDISRGLLDLGFDSLTAVELRNRLNRRTGLRLPATVVFDHPSTAGLARYVRSELVGDEFEQVLTQTIVNLDTLADALTAGGDQQQRLRRRIEAMLRGWEDTSTRDEPSALSDAASAEDLVKYLDELVD
jgi:acyl carrier protein